MEAKNDKLQILTWVIDGQLYGADIRFCFEVQNSIQIVDVPHSKEYIAGIVNLRGDVVTVLDLLVLMGQKEKAFNGRSVIIRLKMNEKQVAIKAESISEVIEISHSSLEPASQHLSGKELNYIPHIAYTNLGLILLLNVEELFIVK
ncbi:MAG: chemotaxis protein CheW [Leptospiraceae bacterium]|nr:chemotaxis protein CheW [Leptospiraceae bacterium]MCP5500367.1 chemotaxis protein CheW [Leptospiraceae bacterium]